jgi:hypothetical protein
MRLLALILLCCGAAQAQYVQAGFNKGVTAPTGPTFVQGAANTVGTGVSGNTGIVFVSNVTSGNVINVILYDGNHSGDTIVFSDSEGNTYTTPATGSSGTAVSLGIDSDTLVQACAKVGSTGADTVKWTINGSGATGSGHAVIYETTNRTSNACTIDVTTTGVNQLAQTACTIPATGTVTTTLANDLIVVACGTAASQSAFTADGSYMHLLQGIGPSAGNYNVMGELQVATTAGNYSAAPTYPTSTEYGALLVAWER